MIGDFPTVHCLSFLNGFEMPAGRGLQIYKGPRKAVIATDIADGPAVREIFTLYATGNFSMPGLITMFNRRIGKAKSWKNPENFRAAQQAKNKQKCTIQKPFMGMIQCFECHHRITGETVCKVNGRVYIYYKCAT
jgi:hypothetical protein